MKYTIVALLLVPLLAQASREFQSEFPVDKKNLGVHGSNPYFPMTPGYRLNYRHGKDTETLTVLGETRTIDGVESRVLEDREWKNGQLIEVTRDYFAIDSTTNDVYYMGEDVDVYKDGKVNSHKGAWLSGVNGAKFGLMVPGNPKTGQRFYQERAPGVGMDRVEIVAVDGKITTPAGSFDKCIHALETSALEKGLRDHKWYAPGVGQVKDAEMVLVSYGNPAKN